MNIHLSRRLTSRVIVTVLAVVALAYYVVVPMAAPDQIVSVDISLKGFTEAYNALKAEMPVKKN